ncbi:MAG: aminopeptidase [Clostridium argentinense]|uniref:aminopeptidase n=1 Tax=uncultured Clostridium sp. TaxID=59620 RepID=UPI001DDB09EE|nr:aminopeptidase [uncultured Clostridium sp.]MBS5822676.1 aminopeptidase [Clostridium argentinense]MDU1348414.1 aminopeptidase [Clostridium argentinense]
MKEEMLKKYARLAVKIGVNIQKDQTLVINSPIECAPFTRMVTECAYKEGAKEVVIHWNDELSAKIKYMNASTEVLSEVAPWQLDSVMHYAKEGAAFLSIAASDPELMKEVPIEKFSTAIRARQIAFKEYSKRMMNNENPWSIVSIPTKAWAKKVFPNVSDDEAVEKLWDAIFKIVRVDKEDPVEAWNEHKNNLKEKMDFLNSKNFKEICFKNSLGTDIKMELPENHLWIGGAEKSAEGIEFIANMPTEEIFSMPKRDGVNGVVFASKPLNYAGNLIENFSLTFKDGKVVDFTAEKGYDALKSLIETDEGSHYLGEVALVPFDSPISNSGMIFFNTLYDENASCHFAIGKAYSLCIKGGEKMNEEELLKAGANDSLTHVDFMLGTEDLDIVGTTHDGESVQIFKNGNWAF